MIDRNSELVTNITWENHSAKSKMISIKWKWQPIGSEDWKSSDKFPEIRVTRMTKMSNYIKIQLKKD